MNAYFLLNAGVVYFVFLAVNLVMLAVCVIVLVQLRYRLRAPRPYIYTDTICSRCDCPMQPTIYARVVTKRPSDRNGYALPLTRTCPKCGSRIRIEKGD